MAPAAEDAIALAAASANRGRRGQRELVGWGAVFCFGSRLRERRTVPVDGDLVVPGAAGRDVMRSGVDGNKETRKGPRLQGCCLLTPPARPPPGRRKSASRSQHAGTMYSGSGRNTHDKQQQQEEEPRSPSSEPPVPWQTTQATAGGSRPRRAEAQRPRGAGGAPAETRSTTRPSGNEEQPSNAFGPVVGLSVVAMAGLLGGRVLAVACVCAWLAALSRLRHGRERRRREAAAVHVDSTEYKKLVVIRRLLERDRTGAHDEGTS